MECDLYVDKIWRMNDKFYMKWKCKFRSIENNTCIILECDLYVDKIWRMN